MIDALRLVADEFVSRLTGDDARQLVDLLKLTLCGRAPFGVRTGTTPREGCEVLTTALLALAAAHPSVKEMLLEVCVTELEDVCVDYGSNHCLPQPVVQESPHPYKVRGLPATDPIMQSENGL